MPRLEIIPAEHCNFHCESCSHFSPLIPKKFHSAEEYIPFIEYLQSYSSISEINIAGGEPSLHPDINRFVTKIRTVYKGFIYFWTNGWWLRRPEQFHETLKQVNCLAVSVHPESLIPPDEMVHLVNRLASKYNIRTGWGVFSYFDSFIFTEQATPPIKLTCNFHTCPTLLPSGHILRCAVAAYVPQSMCSQQFWDARTAGLYDVISGDSDSLMTWLSKIPQYCSYCKSGYSVKHLIDHWSVIKNTFTSLS